MALSDITGTDRALQSLSRRYQELQQAARRPDQLRMALAAQGQTTADLIDYQRHLERSLLSVSGQQRRTAQATEVMNRSLGIGQGWFSKITSESNLFGGSLGKLTGIIGLGGGGLVGSIMVANRALETMARNSLALRQTAAEAGMSVGE